MNPVAHFETTARKIWNSNASDDQKQRQLNELSERISRYLSRLDELPPEKRQKDEWLSAAIARARTYLECLGNDIRSLAAKCGEKVSV